jgi:branched-chain amino acid transport system substrate-binding protein
MTGARMRQAVSLPCGGYRARRLGMVLGAALLLATACGTQGSAPTAPQGGGAPATTNATAASPIRVGFLAPTTGTAAAAGHDMINGWKLWWTQHGDTVAGHRIETIYYDTASNPTQAVTQARKAVEQDKVQMILGPYLANEGLAVAPYTEEHKIPLFLPTVSADDLTQRQRNPYVVRVAGWTSSQPTHPAGAWAYDQGYRRVVTIANQYAFGYENAGGFAQTFTEKGGQIVKQLWAPLGTTDYGPYISQIRELHPDAVFVEMVGADDVHFLEQWNSFGLKDKIPLIANETTTDQSNIRSVPAQDVLGIISFAHYAEGRDAPATQQFIQAYEQAYGVIPSYMAAAFYTAAQWISQAVQQVRGDTSDTGAFLDAVRNVKLDDSPLGPMHLDAYGNPVQNIYIRKVVATSGDHAKYAQTWNVVVQTYPDVSQFWTYNPDQYLKQPVYSDKYQGIAGK